MEALTMVSKIYIQERELKNKNIIHLLLVYQSIIAVLLTYYYLITRNAEAWCQSCSGGNGEQKSLWLILFIISVQHGPA